MAEEALRVLSGAFACALAALIALAPAEAAAPIKKGGPRGPR